MLADRQAGHVLPCFGEQARLLEEFGGGQDRAFFGDIRGQHADFIGREFEQMGGMRCDRPSRRAASWLARSMMSEVSKAAGTE